jgi:hypothetical protein
VIRAAAPAASYTRQQLASSLTELLDRAVARAGGSRPVAS